MKTFINCKDGNDGKDAIFVSMTESGKAKYGYVYGKTYNDAKKKLLEKKAFLSNPSESLSRCSSLYSDVLDVWL